MTNIVELPELWALEFLEEDENCSGYWISSLTQSWQKGYADNCTLPWTNYVDLVRRLRLQTDKIIVVDVDMMFNEPAIAAVIAKELYAAGCDRIVVESKKFPKVNSLTPETMVLSTPSEFCRLISMVKKHAPDLEVYARNEYLIKTDDVNVTFDISMRAIAAGADGTVIHYTNENTTKLKMVLGMLNDKGVSCGIIPTKYLDQYREGAFDGLHDFAILGNICSSFIRHSFSQMNISSLLDIPCEFKPILKQSNIYKPEGETTLIVLGAKDKTNHPLMNDRVLDAFVSYPGFSDIILCVPSEEFVEGDPSEYLIVEDSPSEAYTLSKALAHVNTEFVTIAYADIDDWESLQNKGAVFDEDTFAGIYNCTTERVELKLMDVDINNSSVVNLI